MNTLITSGNIPSGSIGYIEVAFDNYVASADIILAALNGSEGMAASVTFTGINTPISEPLTGTREISYQVNTGYTSNPQSIKQAVYDELNSVPNISNVVVGNVYLGSQPISNAFSSIVNSLAGQDSGGSSPLPSTTQVEVVLAIIAIIVILFLSVMLGKNV